MPLDTFPVPNKDPKYSFPNRFGIPDAVFQAIIKQSQTGGIVVVDDANYTVGDLDTHILYKQLSADRTLTLPAASVSINRIMVIAHGGDGAFLVLLSETIRQSQSTSQVSLGMGEHLMIASDGTDWWKFLV